MKKTNILKVVKSLFQDEGDQVENDNSELKKTLLQIGWKIAKMLMKKLISSMLA